MPNAALAPTRQFGQHGIHPPDLELQPIAHHAPPRLARDAVAVAIRSSAAANPTWPFASSPNPRSIRANRAADRSSLGSSRLGTESHIHSPAAPHIRPPL